MAYEGSVELISGIKTKNNGTFPLVDAPDIRVTDDLRLPGALDLKANLASPTFTGIPKSVTPSSSSNAKMIATKEYVDNALNDIDSYKEGFPFYSGILLIKDASFVAVHRCVVTNRVEQARAQLTSWDFPKTSSAYKTMEAFYAQKPTPEHLILSCYPASETEAQALQTYMTMFGGYYEKQTDFYTVLVANSMTGTRSLELANYVESMDKACVVFIPVIGDVSSVTASGSLADQIYQANLKRTFVFHLSDISECGAVAGFAIATLRSRSLQFIEGTPKGITLIEYSGSDTSDLRALACNYIYGGINPGASRKKQFWALADEDMKAHTLYTPASITIGSTTITESQLQQLLALLN